MIDYSEFRQWIDALYRHPEWREELRRVVLTEEILELPKLVQETAEIVHETAAIVRELVEAQKRTERRMEELAEAQKRADQRMDQLSEAVQSLAEAQKRTEQRVDQLSEAVQSLAEAQKRTEQRVEELAEAQKRTEQRVDQLSEAVQSLAEAQKRTEQRVEELAQAQQRTEQRVEELAEAQRGLGVAVGALQKAFGATVEEEAASVVEVVLRRKGYRILQPAFSLPLDGEIDVVLPLEDPSGRKVWAVVEAKARLSYRDVHAWSQRMHEPTWHQRLAEKGCAGPYLVYAYCIRMDLGAQEIAQKEGIGLLKSDGEVLAPAALIEPSATKPEK
ncbi:MAG: hypothetical protein DDG59_05415 [Anaerolineae bacterium]|nr:MAG: hypothetical protein DDG59_05415 [Anaerolineae bacterium]